MKEVYFPAFTALALLDIIQVTPAKESEPRQQKDEPSVSHVIETIWLVPGWELTHVLMGILSFITDLSVSGNIRIHIGLWNISK